MGEEGTQNALLGAFPYEGWVPAFQGFLPLLIKGLTHPDCEVSTLNLVSEVASLPQGPIIDIDPKRRLLTNSVALLPQLCLYMGKEDTAVVAKGLSGMFMEAQEQVIFFFFFFNLIFFFLIFFFLNFFFFSF